MAEITVLSNLNNRLELSHGELDLFILANIQAFTSIDITGEKRKEKRFRRLKEHYEEHRISPRVHGNRKHNNTLPYAVTEDVKNFLNNYAEENAVLLPGRIPGFKNDDIRLLSSSETKMSVWCGFKSSCEGSGKQAVSYTKFINLWEQFHPEIVVAKPMTDLCLTCQQNTSVICQPPGQGEVSVHPGSAGTFKSCSTLKDWQIPLSWMNSMRNVPSLLPVLSAIHLTLPSKFIFQVIQCSQA